MDISLELRKKILVTIVYGNQAIIIFFSGTFPARFFASLSGFSVLQWQRQWQQQQQLAL